MTVPASSRCTRTRTTAGPGAMRPVRIFGPARSMLTGM